jgi:hypothetical protein
VHIVTAAQSAARNILRCVRRCGLEVERLVLHPSEWRRPSADHAAAKVEALANDGVDEIEVPEFLRNQAE